MVCLMPFFCAHNFGYRLSLRSINGGAHAHNKSTRNIPISIEKKAPTCERISHTKKKPFKSILHTSNAQTDLFSHSNGN